MVELDDELAEYFNHLYQEGDHVTLAGWTVSGLKTTEDAKSKSLRFLEGEEACVKALSQRSPRARLSEEDFGRLQRPSLLGGSRDLALVPAETERQDPRGLVELLSAEIFCIDAIAHDDFSRKICLEALRRRAAELRSSATAQALEAIHAEALAASHADSGTPDFA
eukprot:s1373_g4.t1